MTAATAAFWAERWKRLLDAPADAELRAARLGGHHRLPGATPSLIGTAVTRGRRQPRAQAVEQVMQALLEHATCVDKLAAMTDGAQHRVQRVGPDRPASALAQQPDYCRAVAVIGLEPSRPELSAGRGCPRRGKQAQRPPPTVLDLGGPRAMQRAGRLDPDDRRSHNAAGRDQPPSSSTPSRNIGSGTGSPISPLSGR
jgi:hypothetical protein